MIVMRTTGTRATAVLVTSVLAAVLAGCGGGTSGGAGAAGAGPRAPADVAASSAAPGAHGEAVARYALTAKDLPDGWRDSSMRESDFRISVCGVDLEPQPPVDATALRFSRGALGPFLEQHVRTYDAARVTPVLTALRAALPTCSEYSVPDPAQGRTVTFRVEPLKVAGLGADAVAWRQTAVTESAITADYVLVDRGASVVVLAAYAVGAPPPAGVLAKAVRAVGAR